MGGQPHRHVPLFGAEILLYGSGRGKDISIEVVPEINEPVSSALIAPGGKVVASFERGGEIQHLTHTRADASKDEIWSLAFPWSREDFRFRMGAPLAPLFSVSPESILTEQPATNAL